MRNALPVLLIVPAITRFSNKDVAMLAIFLIVLPATWINFRYAKRFADLRLLESGEEVSFPLDAPSLTFEDLQGGGEDGPRPFQLSPGENLGTTERWGMRIVVRQILANSRYAGNVKRSVRH